jgi:ligand-binding SRPBCC domain-containing protein
MPTLRIMSVIDAPVEICFDLARDIDFHRRSTGNTKEEAVGGVTTGLIGPGESVTWEATHFGVRQRLTSKITQYDRPRHFRDSQVKGAFKWFDHDHWFEPVSTGRTKATEVFSYRSPWGFVGRLADLLFLQRYMYGFLARRHEKIKQEAEQRARLAP